MIEKLLELNELLEKLTDNIDQLLILLKDA